MKMSSSIKCDFWQVKTNKKYEVRDEKTYTFFDDSYDCFFCCVMRKQKN